MADRPNIVLFMTDQQRGDALGLEGHPVLLTPTMDHIGASGARFARAYSTCPSCIAARRSFLSGQFPPTHGMVGYSDNQEWNAPPTLPGVLRQNGYQSVWIGRSIHQHPPTKRFGFDQMIGSGHTRPGPYERLLEREAPHGGGYRGGGVMHNDVTARPWHLSDDLHHTHWVANETLAFLEDRDPACPLFLCVSFIAPHPPLNPPAFYMERYLRQDMPPPVIGDWATPPPNGGIGLDPSSDQVHLRGELLRSAQAGYYGLINHVDDQMRRILNPVRGLFSILGPNTIVVFTSDHGELLGDHHLFRKSRPYEGSARVPMLIKAPAKYGIKPGTVVSEPSCLEDLMPTLLEAAEIPIPASVEGKSLWPVLRGEGSLEREYLHLEHAPYFQALTDGREKYIWLPRDGREQFFDLTVDPQELHDLAREPAAEARVAGWRARLIQRLTGRPEGFTDGTRLIAGRTYRACLPHVNGAPAA